MFNRSKSVVFLALLFLGAFGIRAAAVLTLRDLSKGPSIRHGGDGVEFDALAQRLVSGKGYTKPNNAPTSFRAPGLPLLLAGIYALLGVNYPVAYATFCLLGAAACVLAYFIARELLSWRASCGAAILAALYFPHVYFATQFCSENVFVPCLALGVWLFLRHLRTGSVGELALAGMALGWAALTRPYALLLLPILVMVLVARKVRLRRPVVVHAAALSTGFLAIILPWTARNYAVHGELVLIATNGGSTFYGGNNARVLSEFRYLGGWVSTVRLPGRALIEATTNEVAHDQVEWRLGFQWVRRHLARVPLLVGLKLIRLSLPELSSPNTKYVAANAVFCTPYLVLFFLAAVQCLRNRKLWTAQWMTVHGVLFATAITAVIFWGSPRFRDANTPLLMLYAVVGASVLLSQIRRRAAAAATMPSSTYAESGTAPRPAAV